MRQKFLGINSGLYGEWGQDIPNENAVGVALWFWLYGVDIAVEKNHFFCKQARAFPLDGFPYVSRDV
jgi:hypothetical protein